MKLRNRMCNARDIYHDVDYVDAIVISISSRQFVAMISYKFRVLDDFTSLLLLSTL